MCPLESPGYTLRGGTSLRSVLLSNKVEPHPLPRQATEKTQPTLDIFIERSPVQRMQHQKFLVVTLNQRNSSVAQCRDILQHTTGPRNAIRCLSNAKWS